MNQAILGPNCNVDAGILRENVVLCAGESAEDLVRTFAALGETPQRFHEYKCYRFWRFSRLTVIWTGIGTGCLEPLLWEILKGSDVVRRIVLIGTAGRLHGQLPQFAYALASAFLGPTALGGLTSESRLQPHAQLLEQARALPRASIVSTDFFYGFPRPFADWPGGAALAGPFQVLAADKDLIDMEVAQFYWLVQTFNPAVEYLAIKGPSNAVDDAEEQVSKSPAVIEQCAVAAFKLLDAYHPSPAALPASTNAMTDKQKQAVVKLIEETKLYWTIQVGVVAALAVVLSKIEPITKNTAFVGLTAFIFVTIAGVYNWVGNYYTFIERRKLEAAEALEQENIVTPWIARVHAWLAAMTGGLVGLSLKHLAVYLDSMHLAGFSLPAAWRGPNLSLLLGGLCAGAGFVAHLSIVRRAKTRLIQASPDYRAYLERKLARDPRP